MSAEDLERYETEIELKLYREYRDVLPMFTYVVETERRFYLANGVAIVPTFNDPNDRVALNSLASLMPDRQVVGIHAVDLVWGLGTLHCLSQQQPSAAD